MSFRELPLLGVYSPVDRPLDAFYVPFLGEAVSYDRVTGYFSSSALAIAAEGISRFIARCGTMRLLVGAQLADDDVRAVLDGARLAEIVAARLEQAPLEAADAIAHHRLATLAYLVREGRLEMKVGVPTDHLGRPLRQAEAEGYFHTKYGILTDTAGNRVVFVGSDNESARGWLRNHETFTVAPSWMAQIWEFHGEPLVAKFEALWDGEPDPHWAIFDLPDAVRAQLIQRAPPEPPVVRDPAEQGVDRDRNWDELLLHFASAAPRLCGGSGVGFATAGVEAWPHQLAIARRAVETYPRSYLLADEVGLGKTIEAGLILRELLVSGHAERALVLVPASVIRQWQEELFEKFALDLPRFDGADFYDAGGAEIPRPAVGNLWSAFPVILASSHLARRRSRRSEIIAAGPWDVVLVDEAHHARRRGAKPAAEPNTLLRLLQDMHAARSWKVLYLASATPMQMHAHEAWDLLDLLGLNGAWGNSAHLFVRYYAELRNDVFAERDWMLLSRMAADYATDVNARTDHALAAAAKRELGPAGARPILRFGADGITSMAARGLRRPAQAFMDEWLRAHTPMRDRVFRTTRAKLREYKALGLLSADTNVPYRRVDDRFIPMTAEESHLYERIERYISRFYNQYRIAGGQAQRALGFIMTVYRRRLTSSFLAIERSLQRRRDTLLASGGASALLDEDDVAALEGSDLADADAELSGPAEGLAREVEELNSFLAELKRRPPNESKMGRLLEELRTSFASRHDTVVIFTQYTDTMDYVRDQLLGTYGSRVACYSGRGGERWNPDSQTWQPTSKEAIKKLFREGVEIKILIGTDSLSEGLNLQTCGKLVNYDMPWNFMRVEQRIGRIDRIGGRERVEVANYFYKGTVEEQIYRGIGHDFEWFEDVVGPAQPVLNQIEAAIEAVAMEQPGVQREQDIQEHVTAIREQMRTARDAPVTLAELGETITPELEPEPAIDLAGLERILTTNTATGERFTRHPTIVGAYLLQLAAPRPVAVTFRRRVLEEHAPALRLLTYGTPELTALLPEAPDDTATFEAPGGSARTLAELENLLDSDG
ncbi:MAG: helicase-related protein [Solirubrobacteraceae bacterium]